MTNEEIRDFFVEKQRVLLQMQSDSQSIIFILNKYPDAPPLFFGDLQTHSEVIKEIDDEIEWLNLKINELNVIING